jgi:hypothetical protein
MTTHDYTRRAWGHDFSITNVISGGQSLSAVGWGLGISEGDYLILPNGDDTTRYQVEFVNYALDPADQWFAKLRFAPRSIELGLSI